MQIARFDFSYGDQQLHQTSIDNLRKASKATRTLCATMMDTLGPEIVVTNRCAAGSAAANYSSMAGEAASEQSIDNRNHVNAASALLRAYQNAIVLPSLPCQASPLCLIH